MNMLTSSWTGKPHHEHVNLIASSWTYYYEISISQMAMDLFPEGAVMVVMVLVVGFTTACEISAIHH